MIGQLVVRGLVMWDRVRTGYLHYTISVLNRFYNKEDPLIMISPLAGSSSTLSGLVEDLESRKSLII